MKTFQLSIYTEIDADAISRQLSHDEALDFIFAMDLAKADVGFTTELIIRLIGSMMGDTPDDERDAHEKILTYFKNL